MHLPLPVRALGLATAFCAGAALCTGATPASAQSINTLPHTGAVAPPLHLASLLGAPAGTRTELPHGKVVVLEFWATWCAPCLGEIPAINALAHSLDPAKVQFVSITDEDPAKVGHFLKTHPIAGWVGIDKDGAAFTRYGVVSRPATVVVGPDGKVISTNLRPDQLSGKQLLSLAEGKAHSVKETHTAAVDAAVARAQATAQQDQLAGSGSDKDALFSLTLTRSTKPDGPDTQTHLFRHAGQSLDMTDAHMKALLTYGLGYPETRITADDKDFPGKLFNLSLHAAEVPPDALESAVEVAIASATKAAITHHRAEEDVLVLEPLPGHEAGKPTESAGIAFFNPHTNRLVFMSASPAGIAPAIEDVLGIAVVSEADHVGPCVLNLPMTRGDRSAVTALLESQCGLTLKPGRRTIDRIAAKPAA